MTQTHINKPMVELMCRGNILNITTRYCAGESRNQIPVGARVSAPVAGAHPASDTMGNRSFLQIKQPGHGIYQPPPPRAKVKERIELYLCSLPVPFMECSKVNFTYLLSPFHGTFQYTIASVHRTCIYTPAIHISTGMP